MAEHRGKKLVAAVAVAVGIALATSGCGAITVVSQLGNRFADQADKPKVGECWTATYADVATTSTSGVPHPVPCTSPHQSYTVAVPTIPGSFSGSWVGEPGHVATAVDEAAGKACVDVQSRLMPNMTTSTVLLKPTYKLPTVAAWERGERWVRCDVSEIEVGSSLDAPALTQLPASFAQLEAQLASTPQKFGFCTDDPDGDAHGPVSSGAVYADCTGTPDWTRRSTTDIPEPASGGYPSRKAVSTFAKKVCEDKYHAKGVSTFYYYPSRTQWDDDSDRTLECWTSTTR